VVTKQYLTIENKVKINHPQQYIYIIPLANFKLLNTEMSIIEADVNRSAATLGKGIKM